MGRRRGYRGYRGYRRPMNQLNKEEGKTLRRLMSQNGMNEEEVRSIEKFRALLTEAKNSSSTSMKDDVEVITKRMLTSCSKSLNLPVYHPKVRKAFEKKWESYWIEYSEKICKYYNVILGEERKLLVEKKKPIILEGILKRVSRCRRPY